MSFLDLSGLSSSNDFPNAPQLQAGTHLVYLSALKYVPDEIQNHDDRS